ncbi:MAG TPA: hypothetical protein H9822_09040 [Candidatus Yaniella excrementavium]|nr:hypothetical protein [Candidatus Yaniella excrementavium]
MRWNDLFADLEAQLEFGQWQAVEQDAAELTRGMWADLSLMDRLRGALGQQVRIVLQDGRVQALELRAVGPSWVGGSAELGAVVLGRDAILGIEGGLQRATVPSRPLHAGPSMASIYRALGRRREVLQVLGKHGETLAEGTIDRVGKDHFDIAMHARDEFRRGASLRGVRVIPFEAILLVRASPMSLNDI